jgi:hypothetical protein
MRNLYIENILGMDVDELTLYGLLICNLSATDAFTPEKPA